MGSKKESDFFKVIGSRRFVEKSVSARRDIQHTPKEVLSELRRRARVGDIPTVRSDDPQRLLRKLLGE